MARQKKEQITLEVEELAEQIIKDARQNSEKKKETKARPTRRAKYAHIAENLNKEKEKNADQKPQVSIIENPGSNQKQRKTRSMKRSSAPAETRTAKNQKQAYTSTNNQLYDLLGSLNDDIDRFSKEVEELNRKKKEKQQQEKKKSELPIAPPEVPFLHRKPEEPQTVQKVSQEQPQKAAVASNKAANEEVRKAENVVQMAPVKATEQTEKIKPAAKEGTEKPKVEQSEEKKKVDVDPGVFDTYQAELNELLDNVKKKEPIEEQPVMEQPVQEPQEIFPPEESEEANKEPEKEQEVPAEIPPVIVNQGDSRRQIMMAVFILLMLIGVFAGISYIKNGPLFVKEEPVIEETPPEIEEPSVMDPALRDKWLANKAINSDYVGNIVFDSGLIDLPFVQATSVYKKDGEMYTFYTEDGLLVEDPEDYTGNDVYIWTNWKTGQYDRYGEGGSVFMDFRNNLNDQNLIIYGHHYARDWDPLGQKQFTPLDLLLEEKNYEENKSLKLILDNEIREYVITDVFTINIDNDYELNIMRRNMNEDLSGNPEPGFFREFIGYISGINFYPIEETLTEDDRILTLVTCLQHQPQYRQIIMCRETKRTVYE
ncbi:MAG: sortase [Oscillospiraceae bacterium]|nr:sortase [Oscillospiraceae bacterium]